MGFGKRSGFVTPEREQAIRSTLAKLRDNVYKGPEKRAVDRSKTLKACKIIFNNRHCVVDGTVVNIDHGGAKIKVLNAQDIEKHFTLQTVSDGVERNATIVWKKGDHIGVQFEAPKYSHGSN